MSVGDGSIWEEDSSEEEETEEIDAAEEFRRSQMIESTQYYHGYLPRQNAIELLMNDGDFLVRESNIHGPVEIVISVKWEAEHRHFRAQVDYRGYFSVDGHKYFRSIMDLVQFHVFNNRCLSRYTGAKLRCPIGLQWWEILEDQVELQPVEIGKGSFGTVYRGKLKLTSEETREVAVKTCEKAESKEKKEFLREAKILREAKHPNIVEFIGISVFEAPVKLVMGFADSGNLLRFLRERANKIPKIPLRQKKRFALDASRGLEHLSSVGILHRDIAARNCLLNSEADGELKLMISDFGLSRKAEIYTICSGEFISQRWAAPELLKDNQVTPQSDVWSFGILMWEIFNDGMQPYPDVQDDVTLPMFLMVGNKRMDPGPFCPPDIGDLMKQCWEIDGQARPSFATCTKTLENSFRKTREAEAKS